MKSPVNDSVFISLALLLNRLTLGGYVVAQSLKVLRAGGDGRYPHEIFYDKQYSALDPNVLPTSVSMYYGYAMPYIGLLMGALIIVGLFTRFASATLFVIACSIVYAMAKQDLAVLGVYEPYISHPWVVMTPMFFLLLTTGAGAYSFDNAALRNIKAKPAGDASDKDKPKNKD